MNKSKNRTSDKGSLNVKMSKQIDAKEIKIEKSLIKTLVKEIETDLL